MDNKFKTKRVGAVDIFELWGVWEGAFAMRSTRAIQDILEKSSVRNIFLNSRFLKRIDDPSVDSLIQCAMRTNKCSLLAHAGPVRDLFQLSNLDKRLHILSNEVEVTRFFEAEFAKDVETQKDKLERRQFIRLKTVLPLRLWYEDQYHKRFEFYAVITNLSEGGLFAQFIESVSEDRMKTCLNPYDLPLLNLDIYLLPNNPPLQTRGKFIHGDFMDEGVGMEFYEYDPAKKSVIREWVERHLVNGLSETRD